MSESLKEVRTFSQYLEQKRFEHRLTKRQLIEKTGVDTNRFSRLVYEKALPTAEEALHFANFFNDDPIWVLMLGRCITKEMENFLFSNYELFRNIYLKSKKE